MTHLCSWSELVVTCVSVCLDEWSKEDCLTLLERIRSLLPDGDGMKYKTTESHFDWDKVCFGSFTGDMCRQKWQKVSTEVPELDILSVASLEAKLMPVELLIIVMLCYRSENTEQ